MTNYRGTLSIQMSGHAAGYGPFSAWLPLTTGIKNASLLSDGVLTGSLDGSGTITGTIRYPNGQTFTDSDYVYFPSYYFATNISAPNLPLEPSVPWLGISWNESVTLNATRTVMTVTGSGTFNGIMYGVPVSGQVSASGSLITESSAYSIAGNEVSLQEGSGAATPYSFTVTRVGAASGFASANWWVSGSGANPASASDFAGNVLPSGTVSFSGGDTTKTVTVNVSGDTALEADEGFTVTVSHNVNDVIVTTPTVTATIRNDDTATLSISPLLADRSEGASGSTSFTFSVTRAGSTAGTVSVAWTVNGIGQTPAQAEDFVGGLFPSGTLTFVPGDISRTVTVQVSGDAAAEAHEGFAVVLSSPVGAVIQQGTATGLIINDDGGAAGVADSTAAGEVFAMGDGGDLVRFSAGRDAYRVGVLENRVRVEGPDGVDELVDVEWVKFGAEAAITLETLRGQPGTDELMRFLTTGPGGTQVVHALPLAYVGPLALDYVYPGTDLDDVMAGTSRNEFVNLAGGNDAADMGAGDDVVDGGGGNNFLAGGAGRDAFFLDGRFAVPVWSCITDWEVGETLTLWGWTPGVSVGAWGENAGLPGYLGATFFADIDGSGLVETAVTFAGRAVAEMPAPRAMEVSGIGVLQFG